MRSKINIMYGRNDISDEELERFKNFDALLTEHYRVLNEKKPIGWKFVLLAVIAVSIIGVYFWRDNASAVTNNKSVKGDSVASVGNKTSQTDTTISVQKAIGVKPQVKSKKPTHTENPESANSSTLKPDSISVSQVINEPPAEPLTVEPAPIKTEPVYIPAEPVDGYEALYTYFSNELIYPQGAVKDSIEGVLIVKFLINKEGKPEKIETAGTLGKLFDQEAIRLIGNMPPWKPATINGKPISSKLSLPLTFRITVKKKP